jgi:pimeloyl-ACP methyl ester carboxylesterase
VIGQIAVEQNMNVFYRMLNVEGLEIFNREAGRRDGPTVLLLHGFPPEKTLATADLVRDCGLPES